MASPTDNKALIKNAIEGIWNRKDMSLIDKVTHPDYVCHLPGDQSIRGIQGFKDAFSKFKTAFPDATMKIEDQVAEGDEVVTTMVVEGTQTGHFAGPEGVIAPTGKKIRARQVSRMRIKDGKVVEEWMTWDESVALQQVGESKKRFA